jgi:hypothetical protein
MIADSQTAKWRARYGRDQTDQQRAWLVNKVRTDIAMRASKLNAQLQWTNLRAMHERETATSDQRRQLELEYQVSLRTGRVCRGMCRGADRKRLAAMGATATWAGRSSRGLNCEDQRGT